MGKRKKQQFAENKSFHHVIEPSYEEILNQPHPLAGNWHRDFFKNKQPIVLELGCGKGEYTVGLAQQDPNKNYIGVDIKGSRIWRGAKTSFNLGLKNVAFLRSRIDFIDQLFSSNEVDEIWLTFSDPQPKRPKQRLSSDKYLSKYRQFLKPGGKIHLKTDNRLLFNFTLQQIQKHQLKLDFFSYDIYANWEEIPAQYKAALEIKTYYEQLFMDKGFRINFLSFQL